MKVGIIGGSGKTVLSLLLCNLVPEISLKPKHSSYFSNASIEPILKRERFASQELKTEKNITILMSMLESGEVSDDNISDYAYRAIGAQTNIFESISPGLSGYETVEILKKVLELVDNHFTVIDIKGDYTDLFNKNILDTCDCILYCFEPNRDSCISAKEYYSSILKENRNRYKFICTKSVPYISRRDIQKVTEIRNEEVIFVPFDDVIAKHDFYGQLDVYSKNILKGQKETLELRKSLHSILKWVYGKDVFKEVNKW